MGVYTKQMVGIGLGIVLWSSAIAGCTSNTSPNRTSGTADSAANTSGGTSSDPIEITLVSYAVTQAAYAKIVPKFVAQWAAAHDGQRVQINQSYAGSGTQARAVIDGLEADVVALALALDTQKIAEAGLIAPGWETEAPNGAIVHSSVAALTTRAGNPKKIRDWSDLARPDIKVITANPKTSGGARWNFLALWGSVLQTGGTEAAARDFTTQVYRNVPLLPKDAREATDAFVKQGQGDVLINYENEAILAGQQGEQQTYIIPKVNISIDNPVAVVDAIVDRRGTRAVAEAFVQFLYTPEAQREFATVGFRPVDPTVAKEFADRYPRIEKQFTAQDFGGWATIQQKFFDDGAEFDGIQKQLGGGTR